MASTDKTAKQLAYEKFENVFKNTLVDQIMGHAKKYKLPQEYQVWFEKNLRSNTLGGKCNRGMSVPDSAEKLLGRELTEEEYFSTATLGWLIELLQAFFLVSDDMMDGSITRRGEPCWYRQPDVGMIAVNDSFMLESAIYLLLKQYFKAHPAYIDMVELFHEVAFQTEIGQLCDLLTAPEGVSNLNNFSLDKYTHIVIYKTAYYSFYLPVALALHYLNIATPQNLKQAEDILIPMGEYFQVQDDFLDCFFGTKDIIGKDGTDIQDNKCSWLVNQALNTVTPEQRKILEDHYGKKNDDDVAVIKKLYDELDLKNKYYAYEEKVVGEIKELISKVDESQGLKKSVFETFLNKIYKRNK
ncbi:isoprenoid synthase domain-containing protein [Xylariales sp. PMI_506]|nr:isoprenoid synthase domain-containing protein [Xylariales sp. PMI_506]